MDLLQKQTLFVALSDMTLENKRLAEELIELFPD